MQSLKTPPRTIMEEFQMLPEGTLAELINGTIYMSPAPTTEHQRIIRKLAFQISSFIENQNLGEVFFAPCDVYFDEKANAVQPDIISFLPKRMELFRNQGFMAYLICLSKFSLLAIQNTIL